MTDPRHLLQLTDPAIPVEFGSHILPGQIVNYEDSYAAPIRVRLYRFGPPLVAFDVYRLWPWPEVHHANITGQPLVWC
jgi:hypothetical protein